MTRTRRSAALTIAFGMAVSAAVTTQATAPLAAADPAPPILVANGRYEIVDLGTLGGDESYAADINDAGQVIGSSYVAPDSGVQHAFVWTQEGGFVDLGTLGGFGTQSYGGAVNELGHVVGDVSAAGGTIQAFLWTPEDGMVSLGAPEGGESRAADVNEADVVVGYQVGADHRLHAFRWTAATGRLPLPGLDGGSSSPAAINELGQIGGSRRIDPSEEWTAFVWDPVEGLIDLGTLGGSSSYVTDLTDEGEVFGFSTLAGDTMSHPFRWTPTAGMIDLTPTSATSAVISATDGLGRLVGSTGPGPLATPGRATLWDPVLGPVDLGTLGGPNSSASAINTDRTIVGTASLPGETAYHATLWRRVPPCGPGAPGVADDVDGQHAFCDEIEWATDAGIASGYGDGYFRPTTTSTRQATAVFLHRLSGEPAPAPGEPIFEDVPATHPFFDAIQWMGQTGLSTGTPTGTGTFRFDPASPTTRQAMASFLHRLAGEPTGSPPGTSFADVAADHPFATAIGWMASSGLSTGSPQPTGLPLYRPGDPLSRQATMAFLQRFDALPDAP